MSGAATATTFTTQRVPIEARRLAHDDLVELALEILGGDAAVRLVDLQHAAHGVVALRLRRTQLTLNLEVRENQTDETDEADQQRQGAQAEDDVADDATVLESLTPVRRLDEDAENRAARRVDGESNEARLRRLEVLDRREVAIRGLPRQLGELAAVGQKAQVGPVGDHVERADADDVLLRAGAITSGDGGLVADDLRRLGHLLLQRVPKVLELGDRRQRVARGQGFDPLRPVGDLRADDRTLQLGCRVTCDLTNDAEQLAHGAQARAKGLVELRQPQFVGLELLFEVGAPGLGGGELPLGLLEQGGLLVLSRLELRLALLDFGSLEAVALLDPLQKVIEGFRRLRDGRSRRQ